MTDILTVLWTYSYGFVIRYLLCLCLYRNKDGCRRNRKNTQTVRSRRNPGYRQADRIAMILRHMKRFRYTGLLQQRRQTEEKQNLYQKDMEPIQKARRLRFFRNKKRQMPLFQIVCVFEIGSSLFDRFEYVVFGFAERNQIIDHLVNRF